MNLAHPQARDALGQELDVAAADPRLLDAQGVHFRAKRRELTVSEPARHVAQVKLF